MTCLRHYHFCTELRSFRTVSVCNLSSRPNYSSGLSSLDQRSHAFQAYAPVNEQINRRSKASGVMENGTYQETDTKTAQSSTTAFVTRRSNG
jgi:hypothetical protein